ncbi:MAG TPA: hypothetical protein VGL56_13160 [Fimbriimonadaceae bacterium]
MVSIPLLALSFTVLAQSDQKVTLHSEDKKDTMILETKTSKQGDLMGTMDLTLGKAHLQYASAIRSTGMPGMRTLIAANNGRGQLGMKETYGAKSAEILIMLQGKKNTLNVPYPKGESPRDEHVFWFVRTRPKIGQADSYLYFDLASRKFQLKTTKYEKDDKISYHGKAVKGHKLVEGDNVSWVDDKGMPYVVDIGKVKVRFTRD